jgi:hypothetical protein
VFGQPWLGYSTYQHLQDHSRIHRQPFAVRHRPQLESTIDQYLPVRLPAQGRRPLHRRHYDASLDTIAPDQPSLMENQQ